MKGDKKLIMSVTTVPNYNTTNFLHVYLMIDWLQDQLRPTVVYTELKEVS